MVTPAERVDLPGAGSFRRRRDFDQKRLAIQQRLAQCGGKSLGGGDSDGIDAVTLGDRAEIDPRYIHTRHIVVRPS
jgi:hypothetical protein